MRNLTEEETVRANIAFINWRKDHEEWATIPRAREIFYHGYLTAIIEEER